MSIQEKARLPYQIIYVRCYIAPRNLDDTYDPWIDVTRHITDSGFGKYQKSVDSNDFSVGYQEMANSRIVLDNSEGLFIEGSGYFDNRIVDRSKVMMVAGYRNPENPTEASEADYETTFEGIIEDRSTNINTRNETATFQVLSYWSIISRLLADPGAVTNGQDFKTAIYNLLNRSEITGLLTVSLDNIEPKTNETVEDSTWFTGKQLEVAMKGLLLASNSVMKIASNTVYIVSREESSTVRFQFFGKGSENPANVIDINSYNHGLKRVITRVQVNTTLVEADNELISRYGANLQSLSLGFITDTDTETTIAKSILGEFQYPKTEMELTTDYIGNEINLLDLVTIDNEGTLVEPSPAIYGRAVYGEAVYPKRIGGVKIRPVQGFKVIGITHDYRAFTTKLKLRAIGNLPFDSNAGYKNPLYGQATYGESTFAIVS